MIVTMVGGFFVSFWAPGCQAEPRWVEPGDLAPTICFFSFRRPVVPAALFVCFGFGGRPLFLVFVFGWWVVVA